MVHIAGTETSGIDQSAKEPRQAPGTKFEEKGEDNHQWYS